MRTSRSPAASRAWSRRGLDAVVDEVEGGPHPGRSQGVTLLVASRRRPRVWNGGLPPATFVSPASNMRFAHHAHAGALERLPRDVVCRAPSSPPLAELQVLPEEPQREIPIAAAPSTAAPLIPRGTRGAMNPSSDIDTLKKNTFCGHQSSTPFPIISVDVGPPGCSGSAGRPRSAWYFSTASSRSSLVREHRAHLDAGRRAVGRGRSRPTRRRFGVAAGLTVEQRNPLRRGRSPVQVIHSW